MSEAKVFGDGDITVVFNKTTGATRVYAGQQQIGCIQKLRLEITMDGDTPEFEVTFPHNNDPKVNQLVEPHERALKQHSWVKVIR